MPGFNGNGIYVRRYNWTNDASNGINILASRMDQDGNDVATAFGNCLTRDGQGVPVATTPWNNQSITGVNNLSATSVTTTTLTGLTTPLAASFGGTGATSLPVRIMGLLISNDVTTPNTVFDVAPGGAIDTTARKYMVLNTATTKTLAGFVAGTGQGSLDSGSVATSKFYHVHLIYNPTTLATDILTSLSYASPTLPLGFTMFVPIGAIYYQSTGVIAPFVQNRNEFLYLTSFTDISTAASTTAALSALTVPTGVKLSALYRGELTTGGSAGAVFTTIFTSPDEIDQVPTTGFCSLYAQYVSGGNSFGNAGEFSTRTDVSGRIRYRSNNNGAGYTSVIVNTKGFIYPRGLQ